MVASKKEKVTYPHRVDWPKSVVRIIFGLIWLVDAMLKWSPAFRAEYLDILTEAAKDQASWLTPWFNLWIGLVTPHVTFFGYATALLETIIALALILGFARKFTYIGATIFSLLIWSTAEGFGGPYTAGATDVGTGIIYALVFMTLLALNTQQGTSKYSVDSWLEERISWWHKVAEIEL